jgi:deoxynucleotide monophosphate kinase-like protein
MTTLIGLKGPRRCGKDAVFNLLAKHADPVTRVSIGDEIRKEAGAAIGRDVSVFEADKEFYRPLLQWWGQFRRLADKTYWITRLGAQIDSIPSGLVVITDLRGFPDETEFMAARGASIIRIDRATTKTVDDAHPAETLYLSSHEDYVIDNNGSLEGLEDQAVMLLAWLIQREQRAQF